MAVYGMPIISEINNPYGYDEPTEYCECNAELETETEIETGNCEGCQAEIDKAELETERQEERNYWIAKANGRTTTYPIGDDCCHGCQSQRKDRGVGEYAMVGEKAILINCSDCWI